MESVDETHVVYRYTLSGTHTSKERRVTGEEFVRGFLQHTLPPNLQRIHYYGFLSPNSSLKLDLVRMLVWFYHGWCYFLTKRNVPELPPKPVPQCRACGGTLVLVEITDASGETVYLRPPYRDSS